MFEYLGIWIIVFFFCSDDAIAANPLKVQADSKQMLVGPASDSSPSSSLTSHKTADCRVWKIIRAFSKRSFRLDLTKAEEERENEEKDRKQVGEVVKKALHYIASITACCVIGTDKIQRNYRLPLRNTVQGLC